MSRREYKTIRRDVPRKGNVDRNMSRREYKTIRRDVPRKGNVDRNPSAHTPIEQ